MRIAHTTLAELPATTEVAVVVDVLRAFTTAAYALAAGASAIVCVRTVDEALTQRERRPGSLVMGEVGGRPVDGFDLSNSPAELLEADVAGRVLVQRTTAGTQGVVGSAGAQHVFAASFVCAAATARAVRALAPAEVTLVATGVDHRDGDEDVACAGYLEALLRGREPDPAPFLARVWSSHAGQSFLKGDEHFPRADVELATALDAVGFALRARREDEWPVLRATGGRRAQHSSTSARARPPDRRG